MSTARKIKTSKSLHNFVEYAPQKPVTDDEFILRAVRGNKQLAFPAHITPDLARRLMGLNSSNRKLRLAKAQRWAELMKAGVWELNGQTTCFAKGGTMIDGQHRFTACIEAGVPFDTFIVTGIGGDARLSFDTGTKRTFADVLDMEGFGYTNALSALAMWCYRYDNGLLQANNKGLANVDFKSLLEYTEQNPVLADISHEVQNLASASGLKRGIPPTVFGGIIFEATGLEHVARDFVHSYYKQTGWYEGHPARTLHRWVSRNSALGKPQATTIQKAAAAIVAFNAYADGDDLRSITLPYSKRTNGKKSERYITLPSIRIA